MTYLIEMQHLPTTGRRGSCAFMVDHYDHSLAMVKASDLYRATFGRPARGETHGIRWVNCDFLFGDVRSVIPLRPTR